MKTPSTHSLILHAWVGLIVLVVTSQPSNALEPPDIIGKEFVTVKVGETLQLICHGDEPLQWNFTHVQNLDGRYSSTHSNGTSIPRPYSSTLTLTNINHNDVGVFTCLYNNTDGEHAGETSVYVYVEDEENLLVGLENEQTSLILATTGRKAWIPCRPTSLNVTIQIAKDAVPLKLDSKYDPEIGYVIDPVVPLSAAWYSCIARRGNVEKTHNWIVQVTIAPEVGDALRSPRINATDDGAVALGSTFSLECVTEQEGYVYYSLNWTQPVAILHSGRASFSSGWAGNKPPTTGSNEKKAYYSKLTVRDARKEDAGEYVCAVQTSAFSKLTSKIIRIYDDMDRFLSVTTSTKDIKVKKGETAQWAINITTYPNKYDFVWKDKNGMEISNQNKFSIDRSKSNIVVLKIKEASLEDAGSYQFEVENLEFRELIEVLQLNLNVLDKPEVVLEPNEPKEYFQIGRNYSLQCIAHGFPLPNVAWFFQETQTFGQEIPRNCSTLMMKPLKGQSVIEKYQQTISTLTFTPKSHGIFRCRAENSEGVDCLQRNIKIVDFPCDNGFGVSGPDPIVEQDSIQLTCALSKLNGTKTIEWAKKDDSGEITSLENVTGITLEKIESQWSWKKILTIGKINKGQSGEYVCLVDGDKQSSKSFQVQVKDMIAPKINDTNLNETTITLKDGNIPETKLFCRATGAPPPTIQWTKDGLDMNEWPEEITYNVTENGQVLTFPYFRKAASGKYECTARNRNGTAKTFMTIEVEGSIENLYLYLSVIALLIGLMIVGAVLAKKKHKEKLLKRYLEEVRTRDFLEGAVGDINPELGIEDQANLLPYDRKWEFARSRLHLGMQLGSGAFGRVMKADAFGIIPGETCTTVAVKMVKANADESHIKALMSELKIMVHLGQHVNVVNLLGACTEFLIKKKELLVIVEYCKYGSLLSYMHRHRHTFINQLDPTKGIIDPSIYNSINRTSQQSQAPKLNYAALTFTDTGNNRKTASNGYRTLEELNEESPSSPTSPIPGFENNFVNDHNHSQLHPLDTRRRSSATADYYGQGSNVESMCTDMSYISNSPTTACGYDGKRRSSGASSCQDHYRGDYQHVDVRPIKTTDILCWAFQISRGMDYLASRKVLHGDLAARNVLLAENNIVKICDFGLAKEMYKDYKYKKKSEGVLLPVKWMAIESIYYGVFSTQSDVWSFGVVLWELFTLGKTPYPGMEADDRFYKMLNEGYRMEKPPLAPSSMYDLMIDCWTHEPAERPSFTTLVDRIGDMMEENLKQEYLDLNVPYDKMNRDWLSDKPDYLGNMNVPDFQSESCRPTPERQYENVPQTIDSGYLVPITRPPSNITPIEYQNVSNNVGEPRGHLLVNNTGYMFMNHPSPTEESAPISDVKANNGAITITLTENIPNHFKEQNLEIQIPQLCPTIEADDISQPYSPNYIPHEYDRDNPAFTGVSINTNYVPNSLFFPPGGLPQNVEESEKLNLEELKNSESDSKRLLGGVKRQKNDSGLGSIDSSHFDGNRRSPTDLIHRESSGSDTEPCSYTKQSKDAPMSQHNLSYVSHTPYDLRNSDEVSVNNNAVNSFPNTHSHPSLISAGGPIV